MKEQLTDVTDKVRKCFKNFRTLREFRDEFGRTSAELEYSKCYNSFLDSHVIGYNSGPSLGLRPFAALQSDRNYSRIVQLCIEEILASGSKNVLVCGLRQSMPNQGRTQLYSSTWRNIYREVGRDIFEYIIKEGSVFQCDKRTGTRGKARIVQIIGKDVTLLLPKTTRLSVNDGKGQHKMSELLDTMIFKTSVYYRHTRKKLIWELLDERLSRTGELREPSSLEDKVAILICKMYPEGCSLSKKRKKNLIELCENIIKNAEKDSHKHWKHDVCEGNKPVPMHSVAEYCKHVIKRIMPARTFGNEDNWLHINRMIERFVRLRRFESMSLRYIFEGMNTRSVVWLDPNRVKEKCGQAASENVSKPLQLSDYGIRQETMARFILWVFRDVITATLVTSFYITDLGSDITSATYYRHANWIDIETRALQKYKEGLRKIPSEEEERVLRQSKFGPSRIRVKPKKTDSNECRVITRLGIAYDKTHKFSSVNDKLQNAFHVLKHSKLRHHKPGRAYLGTPLKLFERLYEFRQRLTLKNKGYQVTEPDATDGQRRQQSTQQIYYVKLDAQKCFDNLDKAEAYGLACKLLKNSEYWLQFYRHYDIHAAKMMEKAGFMNYKGKWCARVQDIDDFEQDDLFPDHRAGLYVIQDRTEVVERDQVVEELKEHLHNCLLDIPKGERRVSGKDHKQEPAGNHSELYSMIQGIPQGSRLSTMLCDIVLDTVENNQLIYDPDKSLLLRFVDDFLFLSCDLDEAKSFLEQMRNGFLRFGVTVNMDKTETNIYESLERKNRIIRQEHRHVNFLGIQLYIPNAEPAFGFDKHATEKELSRSLAAIRGKKGAIVYIRKKIMIRLQRAIHTLSLPWMYDMKRKPQKLYKFIFFECQNLGLRLIALCKAMLKESHDHVIYSLFRKMLGRIIDIVKEINGDAKQARIASSLGVVSAFRRRGYRRLAETIEELYTAA